MKDFTRKGLMLVLSSPSGAGKTTLARGLLAGDAKLVMSVSATTRAARPGETEGEDYRFLTEADFARMLGEDAFLEHAQVFGNAYGTPRAPVDAAMAGGCDVLFDIDWQGTQQLVQNAPEDVVSVFILPPSVEELARRIETRGDAPAIVSGRMEKAPSEISHYAEYDYIIVNRAVEASLSDLRAILHAERLKRTRRVGLHDFVASLTEKE